MASSVLGIDIGKNSFDAALIVDKKVKVKKFANSIEGFINCKLWLEKLNIKPHMCLESTGVYGIPFASFMQEHNYIVSIINPVKIKRFAESELARNKTDSSDAQSIARFCLTMKPKPWLPPADHLVHLRQLVTYLESLIIMKFQEKNRLEFLTEKTSSIVKTHINQLELLIEEVKKNIDEIIKNNQNLDHKKKLLNSIPGIGYETTIRILAYMGNVEDFPSAKEYAAFAGLSPKQYESGSSVKRKTRLSKIGNPKIRKALYMPTLVAIRHNPIAQGFYARLVKNGKCKMAAVGATMRKLLHIIYGVLKSNKPFEITLAN
jgi:transposase